MDVREVGGEAGVPALPSLGGRALQVGGVLHGGAEAGRAGHRAVPARHAPLGQIVPVGAVPVRLEQVLDGGHVKLASHVAAGVLDPGARVVRLGQGGVAVWNVVHQLLAPLAAHLDGEDVGVALHQLGEGQVEPLRRLGTGAHRRAEAGVAGAGAVHGDDERPLAASGVVAVDERPLGQDTVQDPDRRQVARADADEGVAGRLGIVVLDLERLAVGPSGPEEPAAGRMEERLPARRPSGVIEQRGVAGGVQAVPAGLLLVDRSGGKVAGVVDVVVHDGAVAHHGPLHLVAAVR